jgi:hypothetical protein
MAACVLIVVVGERYRRLGIGSELLTAGLAAVALPDPKVCASFLHARADDEAASAFYEANSYSILGSLAGHYSAGKEDALLWVRPLRDASLPEYEGPRSARGVVDLDAKGLTRAKKMPWWLRDLLFHFVLPIGAVVVLFGICYALVVLGPLRGISGGGGGGGGSRPSSLDDDDGPDL